jgi:hypothetical protein
MAKEKSQAYLEGYNWAKRTASFIPYNPYDKARPSKEDTQNSKDWYEGFHDYKNTKRKKK